MSDDGGEVTIGEIYRLCIEIRDQARTTNGRVNDHEARLCVIEDRGVQAKDGHARGAGWGGVVVGAISLWWAMFHSGKP